MNTTCNMGMLPLETDQEPSSLPLLGQMQLSIQDPRSRIAQPAGTTLANIFAKLPGSTPLLLLRSRLCRSCRIAGKLS